MITLTTPPAISKVLGGSTTVGYDKCVLDNIRFFTLAKKISATVKLTVSTDASMDTINGVLEIDVGAGTLLLVVEQLDMLVRLTLTAAQKTAAQGIMDDAQDALEQGIVNLGAVDGTQTTGT